MPRLRLLLFVLTGIAALSLTACDDPTSVGIEIIGDRGGEPQIRALPPTQFSAEHVAEVTGNNERTLLGYLEDPLLGTIRSHAYLDFGAPAAAAGFREGTVNYAALQLDRRYIVGDTTGEVTVRVYDMADEWNPQGATSDTTFARANPITSYTFSAADTLVTLELPSDWVARNDTTLRSNSFLSVFHGFYFEAESGNAVIGFSSGGSWLRAAAGTDSVSFPMAKNLTSVEHQDPVDLPADLLIVQGSGGRAVNALFALDTLRHDFALNRAVLRVREDSVLSASNLPPGYVRPRASQLNLYARLSGGALIQVDAARSNDSREFVFQSTDFNTLINQYLSGVTDLEALVLRVPTSPNSIDHLLIRSDEHDEPRLTLTLTPLLD